MSSSRLAWRRERLVVAALAAGVLGHCAGPAGSDSGVDVPTTSDRGTSPTNATTLHDAPDAGPPDMDAAPDAPPPDAIVRDAIVRDAPGDVATGDAGGATCATHPCMAGVLPRGTGACTTSPGPFGTQLISLGTVSDGAEAECRVYGYYRPANLVGTPTTVFIATGSNGAADVADVNQHEGNWQTVADANALELIYLAKALPVSGSAAAAVWRHPNIDVPAPAAGSPSDQPYLAAVIADAVPRLGLDAHRLVLTGASSGGALVYDTACDVADSPRFHAYLPVSYLMNVAIASGAPVAGTERCPSSNRDFFFEDVQGSADTAVLIAGQCGTTHCIASFAETASFLRQHMGCAASPRATMFGTPSAANRLDQYVGCAFGTPAESYATVLVANAGHYWTLLDDATNGAIDTNGFYTAQTNAAWLASRH